MEKLREMILKDIRSDYNLKGSDSFLYRYLRNGKCREKCEKDPEREGETVHKAATDLMYNLGYPLAETKYREAADYAFMKDGVSDKKAEKQKNRASGTPGEQGKKRIQKKTAKSRTRNTILDLMDAWYSQRGSASGLFQGTIAEEEEYQQLFDALNRERIRRAFVPIRVDTVTGAGLYILGKEYYPKEEFPYGRDYCCGLCIVSEWEWKKEDGISLKLSSQDQTEALKRCKTVHDAILFFENDLLNNRVDYLYEIQRWNADAPGKCPEKLRMFFADYYEEDDFDLLTEDDISNAMTDFGK